MQLKETAFAKINLFLNVVGKDGQGYHMLESYFALLNFGDEILIRKSPILKCLTPNAHIEEENIVLRAFKAIEAVKGPLNPVEIQVNKKIPMAAGMGGGSSDAASTIRLISKLYNLDLNMNEMADIAYKVGADVPFFIYNQNAFVSGRGENVLPMKLNITLPLLLVKPPINISTIEVYKRSVKTFSPCIEEISPPSIIDQIYNGKNDLAEPALALAPQIAEILDLISAQEGCEVSRISGSGSTCFGIFKDVNKAIQAYYNISNYNLKFWCHFELLEL